MLIPNIAQAGQNRTIPVIIATAATTYATMAAVPVTTWNRPKAIRTNPITIRIRRSILPTFSVTFTPPVILVSSIATSLLVFD